MYNVFNLGNKLNRSALNPENAHILLLSLPLRKKTIRNF